MIGKITMSFRVPGRSFTELCEPCQKKESKTVATVYCESCDEFQCERCSNAHKIYNVMKTHKLMEAYKHTRQLVGLNLCDIHNQEIKFYCEEDDQLCCGTCAFLDHRKCDTVEDIDTYARISSLSTDDLAENLIHLQNTAIRYQNHIQDQLKDLNSQDEKIEGRIHALQYKVNEMFDTLLQNVVKEGNNVNEEINIAITEKQRKCRTMYAEIEDILKYLDMLASRCTLENMFLAHHKFAELYSMYSKKLEDLSSNTDSFNFEVTFGNKLFDASARGSDNDFANIKVLVRRNCQEYTAVPRALSFERMASIELKMKGDEKSIPFYHGMDFLLDGRLIAADNKNKKLVIFDKKLEEIGKYKLHENPCDLSAYKEDEIAVIYLGGNYIQMYCVTKSNTIFHIRTIMTQSSISSICKRNDSSFILGCYREDRFVKSVSLDGEEKYFDTDLPPQDCLKQRILSCSYFEKQNIIVTVDVDNKRVLFYNLQSKGKVEVNDDQIKMPRCSTIGPFGCVYIICKSGDIAQMSPLGQVLSRQNTKLFFPAVLCISKDNTCFAVSGTYGVGNTMSDGYLKMFKFIK